MDEEFEEAEETVEGLEHLGFHGITVALQIDFGPVVAAQAFQRDRQQLRSDGAIERFERALIPERAFGQEFLQLRSVRCRNSHSPRGCPKQRCFSVFSLQGIIKVSTGPIKLLYQTIPGQTDTQARFFNLQLTDIGIKILGIAKLPPGATLQFFLFGDPQSSGSLGWYAAYVKDPQSKSANLLAMESGQSTQPALTGPSEVTP